MVQDQLNDKLKDMAEDEDMLDDVDVLILINLGYDGGNIERAQ